MKGEITESAFNLATVMQTAFQSVSSDVMSVLAIAIPIAVGIAGIIFVAKKAITWFKGMAH